MKRKKIRKIEEPLEEVRRWKRIVSQETKGMSSKQVVEYFQRAVEKAWQEQGFKCVPCGKNVYKYMAR